MKKALAVLAFAVMFAVPTFAQTSGDNSVDFFTSIWYVFLALLSLAIYFIPTFIVWNKTKKNTTAIFVLNLLAGWTGIGWLVALIWALTSDVTDAEKPNQLKQGELEPNYKYQERLRQAAAVVSEKKCPDCAEVVKAEAKKCRFCQHIFTD
ncbi:MAG TPA: superinfection immunity protein [Candidatus Acidoferrum sp.]|nr:superinfection immunity protein [Candidatus Acidoferrum sp.]